uniref:TRUD domain-containing protein n=1 Tax=Peronospora matthiolae TaxID=2874970 RepID=A0AAV1U4N9_9STRA
MRRYGKMRIVADTLNVGSETAVIRVRPRFAVRLLPGERDESRDWPVGQPDYLQFTLYKRNKGMTSMVNQLASMLKVPPTAFSYAEVKDKRAITTQLCTVYRVPKNRAQLVLRPGGSKKLEEQPYLVGDMRYVSRKIELGDCAGNRITMVIRSLPEDEKELSKDDVSQAVSSWETRGFVNFFGLHRFGKTSTSYHLLGRAVLRKDYKMAVLLVLRPQEGEASKIRAARESFRQHKDMTAALRMLPPYLVLERAVLEGLQQHGLDAHEPAFNTIPKQLRVSFVQAYQYFVWNEMASMRMAKFSSTSAVVGDLVLAKNIGLRTSESHVGTSEPTRKRQRTEKSAKRQPVQETVELTEDNVDQYSIEDVVLPLPGHAIKYPTNEIGTAYRKMLTTDGIDLNAHFGPDGSQAYILDGSYRHIVKKPTRVSFRLERYTDPNKPLVSNDVDALLADSSAFSHDTISREIAAENASQESTEGTPYRALVLEFDLDYGVDATAAVRELLKQSGSMQVNWQTSISQAAKDKATRNIGGVSNVDSGSTGSRTATSGTKAGQGDMRKVIKAQKTTQVAIGRPGFSLGRS